MNELILSEEDLSRLIEMAWEDRTTFDAILLQFGLKEQEVIDLMRTEMKPSSFRMWRERVQGRKTKHEKFNSFQKIRATAPTKRRGSGTW